MDLHEKPLSKGVKFDTKIYGNTKAQWGTDK